MELEVRKEEFPSSASANKGCDLAHGCIVLSLALDLIS